VKTGQPYEELVREAVLLPWGMTNTTLRPNEAQRRQLTPGHSPKGDEVPSWDFEVFAPAGGFRSCAGDLLQFIEANLSDAEGLPSRALVESRRARRVGEAGEFPLGWQSEVLLQDGMTIFWHNGGTGGYACFIGLNRERQIGVIVLANYGDAMAGRFDVDKVGMDLLKLGSRIALE